MDDMGFDMDDALDSERWKGFSASTADDILDGSLEDISGDLSSSTLSGSTAEFLCITTGTTTTFGF